MNLVCTVHVQDCLYMHCHVQAVLYMHKFTIVFRAFLEVCARALAKHTLFLPISSKFWPIKKKT